MNTLMNFWTGLFVGMFISSTCWAIYHFKVFMVIRKAEQELYAEEVIKYYELIRNLKKLQEELEKK